MSGSDAKYRLRLKPPVVGSRRWFWEMRVVHLSLWLVPLLPLLYAWKKLGVDAGLPVVVFMWTPAVACTGALAVISYALWRVEVNLAANGAHPFTVKDQNVLSLAAAAPLAPMMLVVLLGLFSVKEMTHAQVQDSYDAGSVILMISLAASVMMASMRRIHCRGRHAYEELEKGV